MSSELADHYRRMLGAGPGEAGGLESTTAVTGPDLSDSSLRERLDGTRRELARIVQEHLGDRSDLHEIADRIVAQGGEALRVLRDDGGPVDRQPELMARLEAIVRVDGSRPSFMIRDGEVDRSTSPVGAWSDTLDASADLVNAALTCVGRINLPDSEAGYEGTGFLIHENLVLTNRHVLQAVAAPGANGSWEFGAGAHIDFGHEFEGRASANRRALRSVAFCGTKTIKVSGPVDHTKLDLALIELEPAAAGERPRTVLTFDAASDWAQPQRIVFAVGYPASPGLLYPLTLLEQLFQSTFGCKRLAPGTVIRSGVTTETWTFAHDATTLGGNSGSVVLVAGRETVAAGLHYGGRRGDPRENWGHVLGRVLDGADARSGKTFRETLKSFGVPGI